MKTVKFDSVNAFNDLGLMLSSATISPAEPKTNFIDVPNRDGSVDLSEVLGDIKYKSRTGVFIFSTKAGENLPAIRSAVMNTLNGRKFNKITLDRDPLYYWTGRVIGVSSEFIYPADKITVTATLDPYKSKQTETGINADLDDEYQTFVLTNSRKPVRPLITLDDDATLKVGNTVFSCSGGSFQYDGFILPQGSTIIQAKSIAEIVINRMTISYREGSL